MAEEQPTLIIECECGQKMKIPRKAANKAFKCVRCAKAVRAKAGAAGGAAEGPPAPPKPPPAEPKADVSPAPAGGHKRIGELLIEAGLITEEQLQDALAVQQERGGKTFELLIELEYLDKDALHTFLSQKSGMAANLVNGLLIKQAERSHIIKTIIWIMLKDLNA